MATAAKPLPSLRDVVGTKAQPGQGVTAQGQLPTLQDVAPGLNGGGLPSLKDLVANKPGPPTSSSKHKGGGILGAIEGGAHWTAGKVGLAAHDVKAIPGGIVQLGKTTVAPLVQGVEHGFTSKQYQGAVGQLNQTTIGTAKSTVDTLHHPLRDPFQTALTVLPILSGGASSVARVGEVAKAAGEGGTIGDIAKAALTKPPLRTRLIDVNGEQVPLQASTQPLPRAIQALHDKIVQHAIDNNPDSRIAAYGKTRVGNSIAETQRYQARLRAVPGDLLAHSAAKLNGKLPAGIRTRVQQAALELTSTNTAPEDAAAYHAAQADAGVNAGRNRAISKLYQRVADQNLLTKNEHGDVIVNAADHPQLAQTDIHLARVQGLGDQMLAKYGVRTPEQLAARVNAPARVRAGATFVEGAVPQAAKEGVQLEQQGQLSLAPRGAGEAVGKGLVGGETARPGRGFVSYKAEEPKAPKSIAASASSPVVGVPRSPVTAKSFTGAGVEQGLVPKDITGPAARHFQQIMRFVNTSEHRAQAIRTGSPVRQTSRDVLVRVPGATHDQIPAAVNEILGKSKMTTDDVQGLHAALQAYKEDLVPGLRDKFAADRQAPIGTPAKDAAVARGLEAPGGHVWVDRNVLGELGKSGTGPHGRSARSLDNINSAVTAATVYTKVGHIGTRVLTNASTNIIQGSASPLQIADSVKLFHALSDEDRLRALAVSGQHSFSAMPHEGVSRVARFAGSGAQFWARRADARFRFNSIAYEARKAGFDTPAKFKGMLDRLENPHDFKMNAAEAAKVDWVAKRANREGIAYDRLSPFERNVVSRVLWFYPWLRGTANFAVNTALEHPFKAGALAAAGVQGRQTQAKTLGDLPSYEQGLMRLGGSATKPLVTDFSTFSPFATPADVAEVIAGKGKGADFLNPGAAGLGSLAYKLTPHGGSSKSPLLDSLSTTIGPAWPVQIAQAYLGRNKNQSRRMFPKSPAWYGTKDSLLRALVGPAMPRPMNSAAARSAAARERSGR